MKVVRRNKQINPLSTMSLWVTSLVAYIMTKRLGICNPEREWIWWVAIPSLFMVWVIINWKIVKDEK
jgi:hypothetical protein